MPKTEADRLQAQGNDRSDAHGEAGSRPKLLNLAYFVIAGGIGFLTDAGVLALLLAVTGLGPFVARLASIVVALSVTWGINRNFTFGRSRHGLVAEGFRYGSVGLASAGFNYLVYSAVLMISSATPPLAALAFASLAAMVFSWLGYSRLVFQK